MPSGAKKRKAAKRKKQQQQVQTKLSDKTTNILHGKEVQLQNKEEIENPVSQDQQKVEIQNEDKRDPSSDVVEKSQGEKNGGQSDEGAVEVVKVLKSEKDSENVKSAKELLDGNESSSKGSEHDELDVESHVAEKRSKEKENGLVLKTNIIDDPIKSVDSLSKNVGVTDAVTIAAVTSSVLDRSLVVDSPKQMVPASASKEAIPVPGSATVDTLPASRTAESSVNESKEKALQISHGVTSSASKDVVRISGSAPVEKLPASMTAELSLKENDGNKNINLSDETVQAFNPKANEVSVSSGAHGTQNVNVDNVRECRGCCDNQPSAPVAVKKTSWWNCCGLFDAATSSDG